MHNENSSGANLPQAATTPQSVPEPDASLHDLLNDGALPLPDHAATDAAADVQAVTETVILQVEELLVASAEGVALEGGFLVFDNESSPGNTVVKVVLDGADVHQVFEFGTFKGTAMDLNSLLGLAGSDAGNAM